MPWMSQYLYSFGAWRELSVVIPIVRCCIVPEGMISWRVALSNVTLCVTCLGFSRLSMKRNCRLSSPTSSCIVCTTIGDTLPVKPSSAASMRASVVRLASLNRRFVNCSASLCRSSTIASSSLSFCRPPEKEEPTTSFDSSRTGECGALTKSLIPTMRRRTPSRAKLSSRKETYPPRTRRPPMLGQSRLAHSPSSSPVNVYF